jgi:hypothetical protein
MAYENHWLPGFNFNVEVWLDGDCYETLAICRTLALARAAFAEKPEALHDPPAHPRREAAPGGRLVSHAWIYARQNGLYISAWASVYFGQKS